MTPVLETARLRLLPWSPGQEADLYALHADPLVSQYIDLGFGQWTPEAAAAKLAAWNAEYAEHGVTKLRLEHRITGEHIGRAGFSILPDTGEAELGYALHQRFWGQGYATEIASALRDWLFANRPDPHFLGIAQLENAASRHVLEKIGMRRTHIGDFSGRLCQYHILERPL